MVNGSGEVGVGGGGLAWNVLKGGGGRGRRPSWHVKLAGGL